MNKLVIGGKTLNSRLFVGTGKFECKSFIPKVLEASGSEVITLALRRVDSTSIKDNLLNYIPNDITLLPNTSGARNAEEAIRIARLSRAMGCGDWVKIEVISDAKYLMPDNEETIKATKVLAAEGFVVLPYMTPDLMSAKKLQAVGAATVMPLGSPIGTNKGIGAPDLIKMIIDEIDIPVIVDAGIGKPSDATIAMEMGADAVLVNTAIATAPDPVKMAEAFKYATIAGRIAYETKMAKQKDIAHASSPLTGFLREEA